MTETTRSFEGPGIGRGGILVVVIVIVLLVSLFFIPEIIEFQRSFSKKKDAQPVTVAASRRVPTTKDDLPDRTDREDHTENQNSSTIAAPSTLDALSMYLDNGSRDASSKDPATTSKRTALPPEDSRASLDSSPKATSPKSKDGSPSWESLQSTASKDALTKARSSALNLTRNVPEQETKTRLALLNFANGVQTVLDHGHELFTPQSAVAYVTSLDQAVGRAMTIENVDKPIMTAWSKVDLGPAIPGTGPAPAPTYFNPQLTLTFVDLNQNARGRYPDPRALLKVNGGGYVIGDNITLAVLVDPRGTIIQQLKLSPPAKKGGYRLFSFSRWANIPLTVQIHDKFGNVYQKSYDFYATGTEIAYNPKDKKYILPYRLASPVAGKFAPWDVDPRLDARFLIKVWRGTETQMQAGYNAYSRLADSIEGPLFDFF